MKLQGSMVALVTPMQVNGNIDFQAFDQLIDWHCQQGTDAIVVLGTTGESPTINDAERTALIKSAVNKAEKRTPIIVGTGASDTAHAQALSKEAQRLGADALLVVVPYYNKPSQEGLYQHFKQVAASVDIPVILYNVPSRTGCDMLADTVARLSKIDNIVAIKEACGDIHRITQLKQQCQKGFILLSGEDRLALETIFQGGQGVISVTANVAPKLMHEMCQAGLDGQREEALAINQRLEPLHEKLFIQSNPVPVKWSLTQMGMIPAGIRLPLLPLATQCHDEVRQALIDAGAV